MPLISYDFICPLCKFEVTERRTYETRLEPGPTCPKCEEVMHYLFPAPTFYFEGGSPTASLGKRVDSKEQFLDGIEDDMGGVVDDR